MKKIFLIFIIGIIVIAFSSTGRFFQGKPENPGKISVVSTLFPLYDFTRSIGREKVNSILLLPPGVEPHSFEPKPSDIAKINNARIFLYTGRFMEPWAEDLTGSIDDKVEIVEAQKNTALLEKREGEPDQNPDHESVSVTDPHIWLDFENAQIIAKNIADALIRQDRENEKFYTGNLKTLLSELTALDEKYRKTLASCKSNTVIYGGHYAFGYLAQRYSLSYTAAKGLSHDSEPTAKEMISLVEQIRREKISAIFYEELTSPRIAETLAKETGTKMLKLNDAANLSREEISSGITFFSVMEDNLNNLSDGLECQK